MKSLMYLNTLHLAGPQNLLCFVVLCCCLCLCSKGDTFIIRGATQKSSKWECHMKTACSRVVCH